MSKRVATIQWTNFDIVHIFIIYYIVRVKILCFILTVSLIYIYIYNIIIIINIFQALVAFPAQAYAKSVNEFGFAYDSEILLP